MCVSSKMRPIAIMKMEKTNSMVDISAMCYIHILYRCFFVAQISQNFMVKMAIEPMVTVTATAACRYFSATCTFVRAAFKLVTHLGKLCEFYAQAIRMCSKLLCIRHDCDNHERINVVNDARGEKKKTHF